MLHNKLRQLFDLEWIKKTFPQVFKARDEYSHKGTFGSLAVIGGSNGMEGAIILAGMAGLKLGAGKVFLGFLQENSQIPYIALMPELMVRNASELIAFPSITAWVIGCGLGVSNEAEKHLIHLMKDQTVPKIFDADALNLLAYHHSLIKFSGGVNIITPHPGEAARLLKVSIKKIQQNREEVALELAEKMNVWVILKGHKTVIANADHQYWVNESGNSGLASAGTGDVLSGIIGSLLAQGFEAGEAIRSGVWLHGAASQLLSLNGIGPIGLTASEIIDVARSIRNHLSYCHD